MSVMLNCIFVAFALLWLALQPARSYEFWDEYLPKNRPIRQCPTCPADSPELLSSPWYGTPRYYGQLLSSGNNYHEPMERIGSPSHINPILPAAMISHENQRQAFYHQPSINFNSPYNARTSRSKIGSSAEFIGEDYPKNYQSFNPRYFSSSIQRRNVVPQSFSQYRFQPERYSSRNEIASIIGDNTRFPRNKANVYKRHPQRRNFERERSSLSDLNKGAIDEYDDQRRIMRENTDQLKQANGQGNMHEATQQIMQGNTYEIMQENTRKIPTINQQKIIKTPSEKVSVVERADADLSSKNDDNLKFTEIAQSSQYFDNTNDNGMRVMKSMSDAKLEDIMKRSMEVSGDKNISAENRSPQRRQILHGANEHLNNMNWATGNSWNGDIYRRSNSAGSNFQHNRIIDRTRFSPMPRLLNDVTNWNNHRESMPVMTEYRLRIPVQENWPLNNLPEVIKLNFRPDLSARVEQNSGEAQDSRNAHRGFAYLLGSPTRPHLAEIQEIGTVVTSDLDSNEDSSFGEYGNCAKKREIYVNEEATFGSSASSESLKSVEPVEMLEPLKPLKLPQMSTQKNDQNQRQMNYLGAKSFSNREDDKEEKIYEESDKSVMVEIGPESLKKDEKTPMTEGDPNFVQDMEEPPVSITEATILLNFDNLEPTTPTPSN